MAQIGNKINSYLNDEWAKHASDRRETSGLRRMESKELIQQETRYNYEQDNLDYSKAADIFCENMYDFDYPWEMMRPYVIGVKGQKGIRLYDENGELI